MGGDHRYPTAREDTKPQRTMNKNERGNIISESCCPGRSLLLLNGLQLSIDPLQF
jgi:hypothetical protein